ncbi:hypothetical protein [Halovivax limisalsi]|nr:hypothetical protein [Halovivax limisalsi]
MPSTPTITGERDAEPVESAAYVSPFVDFLFVLVCSLLFSVGGILLLVP